MARRLQHRLDFFFRGNDDGHVIRHSVVHENFLQVIHGIGTEGSRSCRHGLHPGLLFVGRKRPGQVVDDLLHDLYSRYRVGIHQIRREFRVCLASYGMRSENLPQVRHAIS